MDTTAFAPWRAPGALTLPQPTATSPARLEAFLCAVTAALETPHADTNIMNVVNGYGVDRADIDNLYGGSGTRPVIGDLHLPLCPSARSVAGSEPCNTPSAVSGDIGAITPSSSATTMAGQQEFPRRGTCHELTGRARFKGQGHGVEERSVEERSVEERFGGDGGPE